MKFLSGALTRSSDSSQAFSPATAAIVFVIDGGGVVIAANQTVDLPDLPAGATITGWTITADVSTTSVVDIQRSTYANFPGSIASIAGTDKPSLTTAQKAQDTTLTGWGNATLAQGDCLRAIVSSNNNAKRITVTLRVAWT
jgi:hypothetical protein